MTGTPPVLTSRQTAGELRALIGQFRRKLREQADPGEFSLAQSGVLVRLEREGALTGTDLAKAEGMKPQSMGPILTSLEERGIVTSAADPNDGRKTLWSLSADARRTILEARATKEDWLLRTIQSKLTEAEQDQLAVGVTLLARLLEP
jgi:DNA-binding MarR family transcriptional regulator